MSGARRLGCLAIGRRNCGSLGLRDHEKSFARWVHLLHTRLVAGKIGEAMVGWFSVALLGLAITGLVLWWPRKIFGVQRTSSWKRTDERNSLTWRHGERDIAKSPGH